MKENNFNTEKITDELSIIISLYLLASFVELNWNIFSWEKETRIGFAIFLCLYMLVKKKK